MNFANVVDDVRLTDEKARCTIVGKSKANSNPTRHFHDFWEILYIVEGERTFFYGHKTYNIKAGDFLCVQPNVLHRAVNRSVNGEVSFCKLYNIYFSDCSKFLFFEQLMPLFEKITDNSGPVIQIPLTMRANVLKIFYDIQIEMQQKKDNYVLMVWAEIYRLMTIVSRISPENKIDNYAPETKQQKRISPIITYLAQNFQEHISLQDISKKFSITESYFSKLFKQVTNFSFIEYLNGLRITQACNLLTTTNRTITEIAFSCGFTSITQFGRAFKSFTGMSALKYRNSQKP